MDVPSVLRSLPSLFSLSDREGNLFLPAKANPSDYTLRPRTTILFHHTQNTFLQLVQVLATFFKQSKDYTLHTTNGTECFKNEQLFNIHFQKRHGTHNKFSAHTHGI